MVDVWGHISHSGTVEDLNTHDAGHGWVSEVKADDGRAFVHSPAGNFIP
jgi:hypothetical protein